MRSGLPYAVLAAAIAALIAVPVTAQRNDRQRATECAFSAPVTTFHTFQQPLPAIAPGYLKNLHALRARAFGRTFAHPLPARDLTAALSIYGYDYIGQHEGYLLFYRRPVSWAQISSVPRLSAPNGQLLPRISLPSDLDPEWPSPTIIAKTPPFVGVIVLSQQILAYPCTQ